MEKIAKRWITRYGRAGGIGLSTCYPPGFHRHVHNLSTGLSTCTLRPRGLSCYLRDLGKKRAGGGRARWSQLPSWGRVGRPEAHRTWAGGRILRYRSMGLGDPIDCTQSPDGAPLGSTTSPLGAVYMWRALCVLAVRRWGKVTFPVLFPSPCPKSGFGRDCACHALGGRRALRVGNLVAVG